MTPAPGDARVVIYYSVLVQTKCIYASHEVLDFCHPVPEPDDEVVA
jgi:hypothetical protein